MRLLIAGAAAVFTLGATTVDAKAASCGTLQAEYETLSRRAGGGSGNARANYERAKTQAQRAGCFDFFFDRRARSQCPAVLARLHQLQGRLPAVGFGFGFNPGYDRWSIQRDQQRLRAAMRQQGCGSRGVARGGGSKSDESKTWAWGGGGGAYRTLCVRACDGYYFPISYSTPSSRFKIDASVCKSLYPPGEAELYVHRTGLSADTMTALKGETYSAKPFAFDYRESFSPACAARLRAIGSYVTSILPTIERKNGPVVVSLSENVGRPDADDKIVTLSARSPISPLPRANAGLAPFRSATPIRKLGSAFYYDAPVVIEALKFARMKLSKHRGPTTVDAGAVPRIPK